jgi:hypothetical protein
LPLPSSSSTTSGYSSSTAEYVDRVFSSSASSSSFEYIDKTKDLIKVNVYQDYVQEFPHVFFPSFVPSRPYDHSSHPSWCNFDYARGDSGASNYDNVGTWVKNYINGHNCRKDSQVLWDQGGQPSSSFGIALYSIAARDDVHMVLEVGTFRGCGSSLVLAKGVLDSNNGCLITVEASPEYRKKAQANLNDIPAYVELGCGGGTFNPMPKHPVDA